MSSNPLRLAHLLKLYIDNTITPQELEEFWQLMSELSDNDLVSLNLQSLWNDKTHLQGDAEKTDWKIAYQRLQKSIEKLQAGEALQQRRDVSIGKKLAIAAIFLIVATSVWILIRNASRQPVPAASEIAKQVITKKPVRTITLPDGSVVTLREGSQLNQVAFKGKFRKVYLDGEAYFDIKHNPHKPFIVHTERYNTIVLGTAFNISSDSNSKKFTLTVTMGKVRVEEERSKKAVGTVTPEQQLTIDYGRADQTALLTKVEPKKFIEWTRQDLVFENNNWNSASKEIGKRFGVTLKFRNEKMLQCRFSGDFTDKTLNECLDILCALTNASWQKEGENRILINGNACE